MDSTEKKIAKLNTLAVLLDSRFRIPYTKFRIGFDSIIGLFPVYGDFLGFLLSLYIVVTIARLGVPAPILLRVCLNSFLDFSIGLVPFIGDFADMFFKSNLKNVELAKSYFQQPRQVSRKSWFLLIGISTVIFVLFLSAISFMVWIGLKLIELISLLVQ